MLEDIRDPLGVFLVGLLAANYFVILRVSKNDFAGWLQSVQCEAEPARLQVFCSVSASSNILTNY